MLLLLAQCINYYQTVNLVLVRSMDLINVSNKKSGEFRDTKGNKTGGAFLLRISSLKVFGFADYGKMLRRCWDKNNHRKETIMQI